MQLVTVLSAVTAFIVLSCTDAAWLQQAATEDNAVPRFVRAIKSQKMNLQEFEKEFQEECLQNGGAKAYDNVMTGAEDFRKCVSKLVDINEIATEDDSGDMRKFMKEHCKIADDLEKCASEFADDLRPCLDAEDQEFLSDSVETVEDLLEFVCHEDGDRVIQFLTKGGMQCLSKQQEPIAHCFQSIIPANFTADEGDDKEDDAVFSEDQACKMISDFKPCLARSLKSCKDPADILDDFIDTLYEGLCSAANFTSPNLAWLWVVLFVMAKYL